MKNWNLCLFYDKPFLFVCVFYAGGKALCLDSEEATPKTFLKFMFFDIQTVNTAASEFCL